MSQALPMTLTPEAAFTDEMAEELRDLVDRAEQGDRWVGFQIRFLLAVAPGLWDRYPFLAMRAERVCLVAAGKHLLDGLRCRCTHLRASG